MGQALYPVLTTGATVDDPAKGAAGAESTGAITVKTLTPSRLHASLRYTLEDAALLSGMDASFQDNLRDALGNDLDSKIIGKLNSTAVAADPAAPGSASDADSYTSAIYSRVDGKRAQTARDIRMLVGVGTGGVYSHMAGVYQANARDSVLNILNRESGGVRASAHIPAYAANHQDAIIRVGMARDAVAALWQAVRLLSDPYTAADEGEIILTANMLYATDVLRADGFARVAFRTG